jgi:hypothetical protein
LVAQILVAAAPVRQWGSKVVTLCNEVVWASPFSIDPWSVGTSDVAIGSGGHADACPWTWIVVSSTWSDHLWSDPLENPNETIF